MIQSEFKEFSATLSMLNYNYADQRQHLMYINWSTFMRLTHIFVYIYMCVCAHVGHNIYIFIAAL